jgi:hypothetical protein
LSKTLSVATQQIPHAQFINPSGTEPWVDLAALAKHIGFGYQATRRMVLDGQIPGKAFRNGSRTLWRFQLSAVDAAFSQSAGEQ